MMQSAGLNEAQVGIKTARKNINNLRYADDTTLMAENEEELKSFLVKVKVESEKVGFLICCLGWFLPRSNHLLLSSLSHHLH